MKNNAFLSHLEAFQGLPVSEPLDEVLGVPADASQELLEDVETPQDAREIPDVDEVVDRGRTNPHAPDEAVGTAFWREEARCGRRLHHEAARLRIKREKGRGVAGDVDEVLDASAADPGTLKALDGDPLEELDGEVARRLHQLAGAVVDVVGVVPEEGVTVEPHPLRLQSTSRPA